MLPFQANCEQLVHIYGKILQCSHTPIVLKDITGNTQLDDTSVT